MLLYDFDVRHTLIYVSQDTADGAQTLGGCHQHRSDNYLVNSVDADLCESYDIDTRRMDSTCYDRSVHLQTHSFTPSSTSLSLLCTATRSWPTSTPATTFAEDLHT